MQIHPSLKRFVAGSLLPLLLGLPLPSAAATPSPQQALNEAFKNELTRHTGSMDMTARIDVSHRAVKAGSPTTKGHVAFRMQARALPTPAGAKPTLANAQGEGRFVIQSADLSGLPDAEIPIKLDGPLSVQWKIADGKAYTRLETMPQSLIDLLKEESEMNLGELLGRWVKFDLGEEAGLRETTMEDDATALVKSFARGDAARETRIKLFLARNPFFLVTRVEKRSKNAAGQDILRLRIRVNPALVNFFYQEALRDLPKSGTARTEARKSMNEAFAKIRLQLSRTSMVVNVNATQKQLERFEIGGTYPETLKDCVYNFSTKANRCTNTGTLTVRVAVGMSMNPSAGGPVEIPMQTITAEEAGKILMPTRTEEAIPVPVEMPEAPVIGDLQFDETSTLVAPTVTVPAFDPATDHALGPNDARVSVITYSDFQCPYCARIVPELKRLLDTYPRDVRIVYRHFPLTTIHPHAFKAAEASECAAKLGGNSAFWAMHDKLFENQAILGRDAYISFARQLDLNEANFISCIDSTDMQTRVRRDADMAETLGLQGTPTSFVNTTKVEGSVPYSVLQEEAATAGARQ